MDVSTTPRKLWENPDPQSTAMWKFMQDTNKRHGLNLKTFQDLYTWSCDNRNNFYTQVWETFPLIHEGSYTRAVDESVPIHHLPRWFEGVRLNLAENILYSAADGGRQRSTRHKEDDKVAVTEVREGNSEPARHATWKEMRQETAKLAAAMKAHGVQSGDRVVIVGAHCLQTLLVMLAATWLGASFSSSSTDMGVDGILQRTVQVNPTLVFFDDGALYNGKVVDLREKIAGVVKGLKACDQFKGAVVIQRFDKAYDTSHIQSTERLESFLKSGSGQPAPEAARVGFQDPALIYYSSGTSGMPKAIVHGVGTLLISFSKEAHLHRDAQPTDVNLQYTTTGWIMYVASVFQLIPGGRAVLYDGSPFMPDMKVLLRVAEEQDATGLGISPRWMGELRKAGIVPREQFNLSKLTNVTSTGMVLSEQLFEWFYDVAFPKSVHLRNITGGTDIAGCFGLDNRITPVYVGGCQGPGLGTEISVFDHDLPEGSPGKPLPPGSSGDLVATRAFPNMPLFLWGDGPHAGNSSGSSTTTTSGTGAGVIGPKYRSAYFERFEGAWAQGDFCAIHPSTGALLMLGRSDGVLNPSGVRFGSGDIYSVIERWFPAEVAESICVGQRRPGRDDDERVVLFLLMKGGRVLDGPLVAEIRRRIALDLTKRHVPKFIFEVPEIPTTVNGKKVELPVKQIISGKTIKPSGTLLNPNSLEFFYRFQEVEKLLQPSAKL